MRNINLAQCYLSITHNNVARRSIQYGNNDATNWTRRIPICGRLQLAAKETGVLLVVYFSFFFYVDYCYIKKELSARKVVNVGMHLKRKFQILMHKAIPITDNDLPNLST